VNLANMLKPGYKHSSAEVRRRAVAKLHDEVILTKLACEDPDLEVRMAAVEAIRNPKSLRTVAVNGRHLDARLKAVSRIDDPRMLAGIMKERKNPDLMMACFERIKDQKVLEEIAGDPGYNITARRIAINMFAEGDLLVDLLGTLNAPALLRRVAMDRTAGPDAAERSETDARADSDEVGRRMDRILASYDAEIVAEMLGAFRDSPTAVCGLGVILWRGGAGADRAAEILVKLLRHAAPHIRLEALRQLRPAAARMREELGKLEESDPDPKVREAVKHLLSEIDEQENN
jgi:hypothetical protein